MPDLPVPALRQPASATLTKRECEDQALMTILSEDLQKALYSRSKKG